MSPGFVGDLLTVDDRIVPLSKPGTLDWHELLAPDWAASDLTRRVLK